MSRSAHITSLDAVRDFRQELCRYADVVREILEGLNIETRRAQQWVEHDRTRFWPRESRRAEERLVGARNELQLAKMAAMANEQKSCVEEQKQVDRAKSRLRLCEEKIRHVKEWRHQMQHQVDEFSGRMNKLIHFLETDIPRALAALDQVIVAVEKYTETRTSTKPRVRYEITEPTEGGEDAAADSDSAG